MDWFGPTGKVSKKWVHLLVGINGLNGSRPKSPKINGLLSYSVL